MADQFEFTLNSVETSVIGQALGTDVRLYPLRMRNTTIDPDRLARLAQRVFTRLRERGLSTADDFHPGVTTAFRLIAEHRVSAAVTGIDGRGDDIAALVLTDGEQALGITQPAGADELLFALFSDDDVVGVLAGIPPGVRAAPGRTLSVRETPEVRQSAMAARRAAEAEYDEEETDAFGNIEVVGVVRAPGRPRGGGTDAEQLADVMARPRTGSGQIVITGFGRGGARRDAEPLSWLDTEEGRYLVRTSTDDGGAFVASYVPAGRAELVNAIRTAVATAY
ncbi:ESX secretion-associated protein EspG [Amycolatopsis suaedae]|uniref:ESX secretion-associated protein EspG n=1 Tax=Amycolatopsis suaedae TaxID=2510978 RepID=A0A4Q7J5G9_9PSEU|nr:ESX secretion-associated protein EspG [Amycolatopsis suaedae]RZQ61922.1 ESX secretion-associated protein EspG [Amycolatopsis suaedae]